MFGPVLPHSVVSNLLTRFRGYHRIVKSQYGIPRGHKATEKLWTYSGSSFIEYLPQQSIILIFGSTSA
jgi:hypothetical protein